MELLLPGHRRDDFRRSPAGPGRRDGALSSVLGQRRRRLQLPLLRLVRAVRRHRRLGAEAGGSEPPGRGDRRVDVRVLPLPVRPAGALPMLLAQWIPLVLWYWNRLLSAPSLASCHRLRFYVLHVTGGTYLAHLLHLALAIVLLMHWRDWRALVSPRSLAVLLPGGAVCGAVALAIFHAVPRSPSPARPGAIARGNPLLWSAFGSWLSVEGRNYLLGRLLAGRAREQPLRRIRHHPVAAAGAIAMVRARRRGRDTGAGTGERRTRTGERRPRDRACSSIGVFFSLLSFGWFYLPLSRVVPGLTGMRVPTRGYPFVSLMLVRWRRPASIDCSPALRGVRRARCWRRDRRRAPLRAQHAMRRGSAGRPEPTSASTARSRAATTCAPSASTDPQRPLVRSALHVLLDAALEADRERLQRLCAGDLCEAASSPPRASARGRDDRLPARSRRHPCRDPPAPSAGGNVGPESETRELGTSLQPLDRRRGSGWWRAPATIVSTSSCRAAGASSDPRITCP